MKRICLSLLLGILISGTSTTVNAQDFLVTVSRDTLNCKLGKMKDGLYPITFYFNDELHEGTIHQDSILTIKKDAFRNMQSNRLRPWYPFVEFQLDGGMMHQFGPLRLDDDLTSKSEISARTGSITSVSLTYYMNELIGYGLKYSYRQQLGGDLKSHYFGGLLNLRFWGNSRKNHAFLSFSGGLGAMYQINAPIKLDPSDENTTRIEMSARSFVGDIGVGYKMKLSKNISVHAKLSTMIGYPGFIRIDDIPARPAGSKPLELGHYCHNMNSVNLTIGFSLHE